MYLLDIWLSKKGETNSEKIRQILGELVTTLPNTQIETDKLDCRISYLCRKLNEYWRQASSSKSKLVAKHHEWLNMIEICELPLVQTLQDDEVPQTVVQTQEMCDDQVLSTTSKGKRILKDFELCSVRTKRRRLAELSKLDDSAIKTLRKDKLRACTSQINIDEILSLIVEAKLTKHQYILIKDFVNSKVASNTFPSYQKVLKAKKKCYPSDEQVSDSSAEVELQSLLNHTATRILESQKDVLSTLPDKVIQDDLLLMGKWGFDGSTGHSQYKQKFLDPNTTDEHLFVTSYVPLQLICKSTTSDPDVIVWKNPRPSSTRYCRVVRFQFAKETQDLTLQEESYFNNKIANLQSTIFKYEDREVRVQHSLQLTMIDGKVCCALVEKSSSRCYICNATPKEMNNIELCLSKPVDINSFRFGLSPLHSWIRFFEYFIHLSYKLDFKKWQARSEEEKALLADKKSRIQKDFREKLGLIVDKPRSGGSGTSNDGNSARKFFTHPDISAEITGLNKDLIYRCCVLLQALGSGYKINSEKFKIYALETAYELVQQYPWYYLPASVHKILLHGSKVIDHALLSIGELSEEAAESSNKNLKLFRRDNTRKTSRILTNTDLLHRLLLHSDPLISSLRKLPSTKKSMFLPEVFDLLQLEVP